MQPLTYLKFPAISFLIICIGMFANSCKKDPCEDITCKNGGECVDGNCDCPPAYEGEFCQNHVCDGFTCQNGGTTKVVNGQCECDCPNGYTSSNCSEEKTPSSMTVTKIVVTSFPSTTLHGSSWDYTSAGPDIYVLLSTNNSAFYSSSYYEECDPNLDYTYENVYESLSNPTSKYGIALYDYDSSSGNDFMDGMWFIPYQKGNGFPSVLTLDYYDSDTTVELHVSYSY